MEEGPRYTSAGFMRIKIIGKSGHGTMPQFLVDPIYVGAKVVDALQSIVSREVNPNDTLVISICTFHSGSLPNIFDQTAELTGTVRTFNAELAKELPDIIERVVRNTCAAYRAECEYDYYCNIPATINDARCSAIAEGSVKKILGDKGLVKYTKAPGGEDFAYFLERTPGVYAFVGCRTKRRTAAIPSIMTTLIWMKMLCSTAQPSMSNTCWMPRSSSGNSAIASYDITIYLPAGEHSVPAGEDFSHRRKPL